jgi:phage shock protein C
MKKRALVRSSDNRWIVGVCGGIAEYFGIDAELLRLACLVLGVVFPEFVFVYLLLAFLMPKEGRAEEPLQTRLEDGARDLGDSLSHLPFRQDGLQTRLFVGLSLVVLGVYLLLVNLGLLAPAGSFMGALVLVLLGVYLVFRHQEKT